MFCAISGNAPEKPVVSTKSGHVFEQSVIEKYVESTGKCPVTQEPLELSDLLPLKATTTVKPRVSAATTIPGMLTLFQNEWDALMLECFTLKQQLETVRQELGRSLYEHDAACRVIARLIQERDDARKALAEAKLDVAAPPTAAATQAPPAAMEVEVQAQGLTSEQAAQIDATAKTLSKGRKKRPVPPGYPSPAQISAYAVVGEPARLHVGGGVCVGTHPTESLVASGGADGSVVLSTAASAAGLTTQGSFQAGKQALTAICLHPIRDRVVTASTDGAVRVHSTSGELAHTYTVHRGSVTGCTLHATGAFAVTSSSDRTWSLMDLESGSCIFHNRDAAAVGYTAAGAHPDGLICATAMEKVVRVWELKSQTNAANFEGHEAAISCLSFSENGYYLATGAADSTVRLWDLRKLKTFQTLACPGPVHSVSFDNSGQALVTGSSNALGIYETKSWESLAAFEPGSAVTSVAIGPQAGVLACGTGAGIVALYGGA